MKSIFQKMSKKQKTEIFKKAIDGANKEQKELVDKYMQKKEK